MRLTEIAEILYLVRLVREGLLANKVKNAALQLDTLRSIDTQLCMHVRGAGHDAGKTADDADRLKLRLIEQPEPVADGIARCLDDVARLDGCEGLPHRVVGRWAEFVNRALFGDNSALVQDDALLPVRPWVKKRGIDTSDMTAMATAFVDWTREAGEAFARRREPS